jgi:hypothetical protein
MRKMKTEIDLSNSLYQKLEKLSESLNISINEFTEKLLNEKLEIISQNPNMLLDYMEINPIKHLK